MGGKSEALCNEILDHILKVGTWTSPTNIYVLLAKSTIDSADTGSTIPSELTGGSYARVVQNTWDLAASKASENSDAVTFPEATANWGTATDFALVTHSSTGMVLYFGKLDTAKKIGTNDTAKFATGDIDITES